MGYCMREREKWRKRERDGGGKNGNVRRKECVTIEKKIQEKVERIDSLQLVFKKCLCCNKMLGFGLLRGAGDGGREAR